MELALHAPEPGPLLDAARVLLEWQRPGGHAGVRLSS
jgi:hypothetical protein